MSTSNSSNLPKQSQSNWDEEPKFTEKTVEEYTTDESGKKVQLTKKIRVYSDKIQVNKFIEKRKNWKKFGDCSGLPKGPEKGVTGLGDEIFLDLSISSVDKEAKPKKVTRLLMLSELLARVVEKLVILQHIVQTNTLKSPSLQTCFNLQMKKPLLLLMKEKQPYLHPKLDFTERHVEHRQVDLALVIAAVVVQVSVPKQTKAIKQQSELQIFPMIQQNKIFEIYLVVLDQFLEFMLLRIAKINIQKDLRLLIL